MYFYDDTESVLENGVFVKDNFEIDAIGGEKRLFENNKMTVSQIDDRSTTVEQQEILNTLKRYHKFLTINK